MNDHDVFWRLQGLSDRQLLERMGSVLGSSRRIMAELIAHLGEVEERRLHLSAACSSMFAYCLKLGMTEDEAYRRIEVARLARRYPAIFSLLAAGELTISAVALLKHHLSEENHLDLLAAIARKSVVQTRELIAARFPRPDVASSVRKLPERRTISQASLSMSSPKEPRKPETCDSQTETCESQTSKTDARPRENEPARSLPSTPPPRSCRIEPLSAHRYKVQLTASAELARKLELARDLMRHSHPDGELGPVVERALDLLIESLMQRRFGKGKQASSKRTSARATHGNLEQRSTAAAEPGHHTRQPDISTRATAALTPAESDHPTLDSAKLAAATLDAATLATAEPDSANLDTAEPDSATTRHTTDVPAQHRAGLTRASASPYIPRSTRRVVLERDGLGCSWVDEHGVRCGSHSWLEYDHRHPRAKGGGSEPENLRMLCRSHNRFAAEQVYGRKHVEHSITERRREHGPHAI